MEACWKVTPGQTGQPSERVGTMPPCATLEEAESHVDGGVVGTDVHCSSLQTRWVLAIGDLCSFLVRREGVGTRWMPNTRLWLG